MTWNTWWRFGPWRERQPLLMDAVAAQQPDVVLLQETWPEQAEALAAATGLAVAALSVGAFVPLGVDADAADAPFGNAVLAPAGQAEAVGTVRLASAGDGAPRSGVAVAVTDPATGTRVLMVATHLNHIAPAHAVRIAQLAALGAWLQRIWPTGPVVMGGDLNLTPYSVEYREAVIPSWVDLWTAGRPGDAGATMVPGNPRFRDTDWMDERNGPGAPPGVRFDYLLARRDPSGRAPVAVDAIEVVGDARHGWPSDHLGLCADLRFPAAD